MKSAWQEGKNIGKIPVLSVLLLSPLLLLLNRNSKKPFSLLAALESALPYAVSHPSFSAAFYERQVHQSGLSWSIRA